MNESMTGFLQLGISKIYGKYSQVMGNIFYFDCCVSDGDEPEMNLYGVFLGRFMFER